MAFSSIKSRKSLLFEKSHRRYCKKDTSALWCVWCTYIYTAIGVLPHSCLSLKLNTKFCHRCNHVHNSFLAVFYVEIFVNTLVSQKFMLVCLVFTTCWNYYGVMWHGLPFIWRGKKFLMWSFKVVNSWCTLVGIFESGSTCRTSKNYLASNICNCKSFFLIPKIIEKKFRDWEW